MHVYAGFHTVSPVQIQQSCL